VVDGGVKVHRSDEQLWIELRQRWKQLENHQTNDLLSRIPVFVQRVPHILYDNTN